MLKNRVHRSTLIEIGISFLAFLLLFLGARSLLANVPTTLDMRDMFNNRIVPSLPSGESLDWEALQRLYESRNFKPAWYGYANNDRIDAAFHTLDHADEEGLDPADYRTGELHALRRTVPPRDFELVLSTVMLRYAKDLYAGRLTPGRIDRDAELPPPAFDAARAFAAALVAVRPDMALAFPHPPHRRYETLKQALAHYRAIAAQGGWDAIEPPRRNDPTQSDALRSRLRIEDPAVAAEAPDADNSDLSEAIRRFQIRHGLLADGKLGPGTLAALNVPAAQRIDQIVANMERWRWVGTFPDTFIEVNVPSVTLVFRKNGATAFTAKIIAGKPNTPTPLFRAAVNGITVNPPWNVPANIARNELMPKIRRDPGYLARHRMIITGEGNIRQLPGSNNALGQVKLEMPNRFGTYLHDTSARSLFAKDYRFLSHGCMRVEQAVPFAALLAAGAGIKAEDFQAALASGSTKTFRIDAEVPVYVLYWTAMANDDGSVSFLPDVYGRDRRLIAALQPKLIRASAAQLSLHARCRA